LYENYNDVNDWLANFRKAQKKNLKQKL
jgi:hypothetical protein